MFSLLPGILPFLIFIFVSPSILPSAPVYTTSDRFDLAGTLSECGQTDTHHLVVVVDSKPAQTQ